MTRHSTNSTDSTTEGRSLYPPEHPRQRQRYYFDDTLDAYPPFHLFHGTPTPEAMEAAKQLAAKRGYPMPRIAPEAADGQDAQDGQHAATAASPASVEGAPAGRPKG